MAPTRPPSTAQSGTQTPSMPPFWSFSPPPARRAAPHAQVWLRLRSHGYFVEILSEDYTTFDAALYSVLLVVDSEEEFFDEEVSKIAADVRDRGLTLIVFADWYNAEAMRRVEFHDDSTRRWMRPVCCPVVERLGLSPLRIPGAMPNK